MNMEETLKIRMSTELHEKLVKLALELDRPLAWVVRAALEDFLYEDEGKSNDNA